MISPSEALARIQADVLGSLDTYALAGELAARGRLDLRRVPLQLLVDELARRGLDPDGEDRIRVGQLEVAANAIIWRGELIRLTVRELQIVRLLALYPRGLTARALVSKIWRDVGDPLLARQHLYQVRRRVPGLIARVGERSVLYRLTEAIAPGERAPAVA